jgi:hypothetical protein
MSRDAEPPATGDAVPFMTIDVPGASGGAVTLTAIGRHGRTVVAAVWTRNGQEHRDSIEVETFEDAHVIAREVAGEIAAGRAPDLARRGRADGGGLASEGEAAGHGVGAALARSALMLGALAAAFALALVIAVRRVRVRRRRQGNVTAESGSR